MNLKFLLGIAISAIGWVGLWQLTDFPLFSSQSIWLIVWVSIIVLGQYITNP